MPARETTAPPSASEPAPPGPSHEAATAWRRNLIALTGAVFVGFTGFTLVMPFLPIYIRQMGVEDVGTIAAWTGVTLGVTPAMTALFAPLWGRLADRYGRKFMVARSLFSFVVIMSLMAMATHPWHLLALRVLQGFFAGYGALCLAMAAESAPPDRMTQSIGLVQTAQRLGPALGPIIGGGVAGLVGLRATFFVTAGFYAAAFVLVLMLYKERPQERAAARAEQPPGRERITFRSVLAFENFLLLMIVIFAFQFVDRSLGPVLPLYIAAMPIAESRVTLASGSIFTVLGLAAAVGHHTCARLLARWNSRRVITAGALATAGTALAMTATSGPWTLGVVSALFGYGIGVTMTAAYTTAASVVPPAARATGFGFLTSASLVGLAASPMVAGALAGIGIRTVFVVNAVILLGLAVAVRRVMVDTATVPAALTDDVEAGLPG